MKDTVIIKPDDLSQREMHHLLLNAVVPRPISFVSTVDAEGRVNLSPFSFFNVFSSNPPILVFSPSLRGRDSTAKDTLENVHQVKEAAVSMVNFGIVEQMSLSSTEYEKGVNEFVKSGLTEAPCTLIKPPMVKEAPVSFECKVNQIVELGKGPGAGNLVICEVLLVHIHSQYLDANGKLDGNSLDLVARMGGPWYSRMIESSFFEIEKPLAEKGMGVDKLPNNAKNSSILTGNELARLGNQKASEGMALLDSIKSDDEVQSIITWYGNDPNGLIRAIHLRAQSMLEAGKPENALALLMHLEERL